MRAAIASAKPRKSKARAQVSFRPPWKCAYRLPISASPKRFDPSGADIDGSQWPISHSSTIPEMLRTNCPLR
jgi:hypothetical protein